MNRNEMDKLIISRYHIMRRLALRLASSDADELLHDTCIKLMSKPERYSKLEGSDFLQFVKVVMLRTHLRRVQKSNRHAEIQGLYCHYKKATSFNPSISDFALLHESLTQYLKNDYELEIINMLLEGYTFQEIGDHYNTSMRTIFSRQSAVRKRLKKAMS